ncbi:hypothetical protein KOR34_19270 [Posidoniimonas corsicana]|uniref:PEP-CTERM protein-sorting domain-containing protein n=1 Tax=Posidoniimonas corsicana TaxID=1938618 RepID=A0A5C5VFV2_9BACT|nr:hypothetical protein [Posidoniimonas corsicana]TWT36981.1 hypothetical protein KOR34_19270 [Posidoniimonas corsicana]
MKSTHLCLFVLALVAGPAIQSASAISLIPDADARLANDSNRGPTSNVGSSGLWEVRWHEAPRVRIGYVRYDITGVSPSLFADATLSGTFTASSYNGPGTWDVYGLNDDVVANAGTGRQGNDWDESTINYANAGGVDNSAAEGTFAFTDSSFLGTITLDGVDEQPLPFSSNPTDLSLETFLNADTDGLVTFLFMDSSQTGAEYRIDSKEGNMEDGHGPTTLNFELNCDPGDVDCMGGVTLDDLAIIAANFRTSNFREFGDLTGDGFVDFDDFGEWKDNYTGSLEGVDLSFLSSPAPEPSASMLVATLLVSCIGRRRSAHPCK